MKNILITIESRQKLHANENYVIFINSHDKFYKTAIINTIVCQESAL